MKDLFGRFRIGPRNSPEKAVLALDLTTEAIILHERTAQGVWSKFATARLDDPEFPIVIGLLRDEALAHAGNPQPVCLWLPGEQVLKLRVRIKDGSPTTRLKAGFDYIGKETVYRPGDVAIAVSPPDRAGETTLLITFAETWREVVDCATRWGFVPGEVSTRHHCMDFGADGRPSQLLVNAAGEYNLLLCDHRGDVDTGGGVAAGRWINIRGTGRPRIYADQADVQAWLGGC